MVDGDLEDGQFGFELTVSSVELSEEPSDDPDEIISSSDEPVGDGESDEATAPVEATVPVETGEADAPNELAALSAHVTHDTLRYTETAAQTENPGTDPAVTPALDSDPVDIPVIEQGEGTDSGTDGTGTDIPSPTQQDSPVPYANEITSHDAEKPGTVSAKNDANGVFSFGEFIFTKPGTYVYEIREISGNLPNIRYDQRVCTVTVIVTRDEATRALKADVTTTLGGNPTDEIAFENVALYGNLTVTKSVTGNAGDKTKEFSFTVMLGKLGDTVISGTYGEMTFTGGVAKFTLKHGKSKTATGLPAGISYTVTETEADMDGYDTSASGSSGTVPGGGAASAGFTNTKDEMIEQGKGNLIVSKIVGGTEGDKNQLFTFVVTLSDNELGVSITLSVTLTVMFREYVVLVAASV